MQIRSTCIPQYSAFYCPFRAPRTVCGVFPHSGRRMYPNSWSPLSLACGAGPRPPTRTFPQFSLGGGASGVQEAARAPAKGTVPPYPPSPSPRVPARVPTSTKISYEYINTVTGCLRDDQPHCSRDSADDLDSLLVTMRPSVTSLCCYCISRFVAQLLGCSLPQLSVGLQTLPSAPGSPSGGPSPSTLPPPHDFEDELPNVTEETHGIVRKLPKRERKPTEKALDLASSSPPPYTRRAHSRSAHRVVCASRIVCACDPLHASTRVCLC